MMTVVGAPIFASRVSCLLPLSIDVHLREQGMCFVLNLAWLVSPHFVGILALSLKLKMDSLGIVV